MQCGLWPVAKASMANNDALIKLLTVLVQEFKTSLSSQIDKVLGKIEQFEESRKTTDKIIYKLSNDLQKQQQELSDLKSFCHQNMIHIPVQQTSTNTCAQPNNMITTNTQTRHSPERGIRRNNLIITGIDTTGQDPKIIISNFLLTHFSTKQDALLAVQQINTRSQNGTTSTRGPETSAAPPLNRFLVTFKSVWDAQSVYNQRLQKLKNFDVFISEDLNPIEASLFYKARQLKKANKIHTTWTKDGKVFVRQEFGQEPIELYTGHPLFLELTKTTANDQPYHNQNTPSTVISPPSISSSTSSHQEINKETITVTPHDSSVSPSPSLNISEILNEDIEEDELKQLLEGALTGAITQAQKKKKKTKE